MKKRYIVGETDLGKSRFHLTETPNVYRMKMDEAMNEAIILFTGEMLLTKALSRKATLGAGTKKAKFSSQLFYLEKALEDSDLAIAQLKLLKSFLYNGKAVKDVSDFMAALKDAGFAAALYRGDSADIETVAEVIKEKMAAYTAEVSSWNLYEVNGISVAIVNLGSDGMGALEKAIQEAKTAGAEFVFVLAQYAEEKAAKKIAEAGADYIVMHGAGKIMPYYTIELDEEKVVPVMSSLGVNLSTKGSADKSILLKVRLLKDLKGKISIEDEYIPCTCIKSFKKLGTVIVPTMQYYNENNRKKERKKLNKEIETLVGEKLKKSKKIREIKNKNGFQPQLSINEICEILGVSTDFYKGKFPLDKKVHSIVIRKTELDKGCVAVFAQDKKKINITAELAKKAGALFAISNKEEAGLSTLVVEDPTGAFITLAKAIRKKYNPFTVGITGTVGKSTTTDLIKSVIKQDYNMLDVRGNYNHYRTVGFCIQKLSPEHDAYVQELHGGTKGAAKLGSNLILPNACVITNIGDAHLSQVGTIDDVLREKLGVIDALQPGGTLFVNNDNEYLQKIDVPVNVVRYAVHNQDSDYYAQNIVDYGDRITFQIVCKEGIYDAIVYCPGIHNVGNAIAAFAVGRLAGIAPHRIIAGISRYRTSGIRQNIVRMDGYKIVVDCFSATPDSMYSSMKSFSLLETEKGGRHIAIIGDVADLAKKSVFWHKEFGKQAAELGIDVVITLGKRARRTAETARECGVEAYDFIDRDEFEAKICEIIRPGDNLLFKSSHPIDLAKSAENIFGIK